MKKGFILFSLIALAFSAGAVAQDGSAVREATSGGIGPESGSPSARPREFKCDTAMLAIFDAYHAEHGATLIPPPLTATWTIDQAEAVATPILCEKYVEKGRHKGVLVVRRQYLINGTGVANGQGTAGFSIYVFAQGKETWRFEKGKKAVVEESPYGGRLVDVALVKGAEGYRLNFEFEASGRRKSGTVDLSGARISRLQMAPEPGVPLSVLAFVLAHDNGERLHQWKVKDNAFVSSAEETDRDGATVPLDLSITVDKAGFSPDGNVYAALTETATTVPEEHDRDGFTGMELNSFRCDLLVMRKGTGDWQVEFVGEVDRSEYSGGTRGAKSCASDYQLAWVEGRPAFTGKELITGPYAGGVYSRAIMAIKWTGARYEVKAEILDEGPIEEIFPDEAESDESPDD